MSSLEAFVELRRRQHSSFVDFGKDAEGEATWLNKVKEVFGSPQTRQREGVDADAMSMDDLRSSSRPSTGILGPFEGSDELANCLQLVEAALLSYHYSPVDSQAEISRFIRSSVRATIQGLKDANVLRNDRHENILTLFELFSFRTLLAAWARVNDSNVRATVLAAAKQLCQPHLNVASFRQLHDALQSTEEASILLPLVVAAAKAVPVSFEPNVSLVQRLDPSALPEVVAPTGASSDKEDKYTYRPLQDEGEPAPKRQRNELVVPHAAPQAVARTAAPNAPSTAVMVQRHAFECRSKYHARFSSAEKHASNSCKFCNICHMMEFLFNGCRRDCTWNHKPTARKVSLHLRDHPTVLALAQKRFEEMQRGVVLEPLEI